MKDFNTIWGVKIEIYKITVIDIWIWKVVEILKSLLEEIIL